MTSGGGWRRLGRIGAFDGAGSWSFSHTALPALWPTGTGEWDLYASARDAEGRSAIGRSRFTMTPEPRIDPQTIQRVLEPGALGTFDDRGVSMSCVVRHDEELLLYYSGWMLGVTVPFYLGIGLAVSDDNGRTFRRVSRAPVLERTDAEPFLTASPFVIVDGGRWRMWYVSGTEWVRVSGGAQHRYHIRYAESADGVVWRRHQRPCIDYASPSEYAFGRPFVLHDAGVYRMWYPYRGDRYSIGYAESGDGIEWRRLDDHRGLSPAEEGWDAGMVAYPWVFDWNGGRYMLYNGNDYGRSGVGLAVAGDDPSAPRS